MLGKFAFSLLVILTFHVVLITLGERAFMVKIIANELVTPLVSNLETKLPLPTNMKECILVSKGYTSPVVCLAVVPNLEEIQCCTNWEECRDSMTFSANGPSGKKEVLLRYGRECPGFVSEWNSSLKVRKLSRTVTSMDIYIHATTPVDKTVKIRVNLAIWTNGGWKPNFYKAEFNDLCNTVKTYLYKTFQQFCRDSNITETCPVRPGPILVHNYILDLKEMNVPTSVLPLGKLRGDVTIYRKAKQVLCYSAVLEVVQKR